MMRAHTNAILELKRRGLGRPLAASVHQPSCMCSQIGSGGRASAARTVAATWRRPPGRPRVASGRRLRERSATGPWAFQHRHPGGGGPPPPTHREARRLKRKSCAPGRASNPQCSQHKDLEELCSRRLHSLCAWAWLGGPSASETQAALPFVDASSLHYGKKPTKLAIAECALKCVKPRRARPCVYNDKHVVYTDIR